MCVILPTHSHIYHHSKYSFKLVHSFLCQGASLLGTLDKWLAYLDQDPIMAQFPLALAIEPKLLPYAVKNGFYMDGKARFYFCSWNAYLHLIDPLSSIEILYFARCSNGRPCKEKPLPRILWITYENYAGWILRMSLFFRITD